VHDPGDVGHDVQPTVPGDDVGDDRVHLGRVRHVEADHLGLAPGALHVLGGDRRPVGVTVGADDRRAGLGETLGRGPADAAGGPGDDGDTVLEIEGFHGAGP
jgi:hypothetical protein